MTNSQRIAEGATTKSYIAGRFGSPVSSPLEARRVTEVKGNRIKVEGLDDWIESLFFEIVSQEQAAEINAMIPLWEQKAAAFRAYHLEMIRCYGPHFHAAQYQQSHDDPACQLAKDRFEEAHTEWLSAQGAYNSKYFVERKRASY